VDDLNTSVDIKMEDDDDDDFDIENVDVIDIKEEDFENIPDIGGKKRTNSMISCTFR